jgi:hypothetical protein
MDSRECWPLGRGLATLTPRTDPPTDMRPYGMRQAVTVTATADDIEGIVYDPATQMLALTESTGDSERERLLIVMKTARATDRDGSKPTTPKDLQTD